MSQYRVKLRDMPEVIVDGPIVLYSKPEQLRIVNKVNYLNADDVVYIFDNSTNDDKS